MKHVDDAAPAQVVMPVSELHGRTVWSEAGERIGVVRGVHQDDDGRIGESDAKILVLVHECPRVLDVLVLVHECPRVLDVLGRERLELVRALDDLVEQRELRRVPDADPDQRVELGEHEGGEEPRRFRRDQGRHRRTV